MLEYTFKCKEIYDLFKTGCSAAFTLNDEEMGAVLHNGAAEDQQKFIKQFASVDGIMHGLRDETKATDSIIDRLKDEPEGTMFRLMVHGPKDAPFCDPRCLAQGHITDLLNGRIE